MSADYEQGIRDTLTGLGRVLDGECRGYFVHDGVENMARRIEALRLRVEQAEEKLPSCGICGGPQSTIRGRHPGSPTRRVCPTCMADRLEIIAEYASRGYHNTYTPAARRD